MQITQAMHRAVATLCGGRRQTFRWPLQFPPPLASQIPPGRTMNYQWFDVSRAMRAAASLSR